MILRRTVLTGFLVAALLSPLALMAPAAAQQSEIYTNSATGIAINGYDPVAYFTEGRPVEGSAEFSAEWKGAPWHFSSAENRDLFLSDPEHYAPQYGGWCAFAMAQGAFATTVPEAWTVKDDKLYLNFSTGVRQLWQADADNLITLADGFWAENF